MCDIVVGDDGGKAKRCIHFTSVCVYVINFIFSLFLRDHSSSSRSWNTKCRTQTRDTSLSLRMIRSLDVSLNIYLCLSVCISGSQLCVCLTTLGKRIKSLSFFLALSLLISNTQTLPLTVCPFFNDAQDRNLFSIQKEKQLLLCVQSNPVRYVCWMHIISMNN